MSHQCNSMFNCACGSPLWKSILPEGLDISKNQNIPSEKHEDMMFHAINGGTIITMRNGRKEFVEAVGVRDGKVWAVGTAEEVIENLADREPCIITRKYIEGKNTLLPAFIEPHTHIIPTAVVNTGTNLSPFDGQDLRQHYDVNWVIEQLKTTADKKSSNKNTDQPLILGHNVDPSLFHGEIKLFNANILDRVQTDSPIMVFNTSGHLAYINSAAIHRINAYNDKPSNKQKISTGDNGILAEFSEILPVLNVLIDYSSLTNEEKLAEKENVTKEIYKIFDTAVSRGATYMLDAALDKGQYSALENIAKSGNCPVRIGGAYLIENLSQLESDVIGNYRPNTGDEYFNLAFLKLVSDGSAQGLTAYQYTPYDCNENYDRYTLNVNEKIIEELQERKEEGYKKIRIDTNLDADTTVFFDKETEIYKNNKIDIKAEISTQADIETQAHIKTQTDIDTIISIEKNKNAQFQKNTGLFNYGYPLEFNALLNTANNYGWPTMIHANGDHAIERTLSAFKAAGINASTIDQRRDRIEHCSLLTKEYMTQMAQLGISPSFTIGHVGYWGWHFKNTIIGEQRAEQLDLCRSTLNDHNMRITLHSDYSVTPLGPLRMMEQSITRLTEDAPNQNKAQHVLNPSQCITPFQALKAMTYDAAWQCHADQWVGSIEVGKCADFVILEQSPLTYQNVNNAAHPAQGMRNITVLETWKGGKQVYSHPSCN